MFAAAYETADRIGSQGVNPFVSSCVTATLRVMNFRALFRRATVAPRLALYWRPLTCAQINQCVACRWLRRLGVEQKGEELTPPRRRAGVTSMAWRS